MCQDKAEQDSKTMGGSHHESQENPVHSEEQRETIEHLSHGGGFSRYGNFHNYYRFNPPVKRLSLLSSEWPLPLSGRSSLTVFDVGCNSGELTLMLHLQLRKLGLPLRTIGVDIDPVLIRRANSLKLAGESSQHDQHGQHEGVDDRLEFHTADVMVDISSLDTFSAGKRYDLGLCFAVTMWVHLNHGDEGLRQFLRTIASRCDFLLLEPQTWKCYRNASRRMRCHDRSDFQDIDKLEWKNDVLERIDEFLHSDCQMVVERRFGVTDWGRPLTLYRAREPTLNQGDR